MDPKAFIDREERLRSALQDAAWSEQHTGEFRSLILDYYSAYGRCLPWRETTDPYRILVSEVMLQQTQVDRVLAKYPEFLAQFPDFPSLAAAPLGEVLRVWKGLGYNRSRSRNLRGARRPERL